MASQFGQIPGNGGKVLQFLKEFRKIVETNTSTDDKIEALHDLEPQYPEYRDLVHGDFARHWFCPKLWRRLDVGWKTAERLYEAGLRTAEEVLAAPDAKLLAISGIGPKTVERIRASGGACGSRSAS
jgi:hypothetical protein